MNEDAHIEADVLLVWLAMIFICVSFWFVAIRFLITVTFGDIFDAIVWIGRL